jgi:hypothetical protein
MRGEEQRVVIVSHGGPHSWLCAHYLGTPLAQLRAYMLNPGRLFVWTQCLIIPHSIILIPCRESVCYQSHKKLDISLAI